MFRYRRRLPLFVYSCIGIVACSGDGPTAPYAPLTGNVVDQIAVDFSPLPLRVGGARPISAQALNARGEVVQSASINFSSSDTAVAMVAAGTVYAHKVGTALISAASGGKSSTLQITVTPLPVIGLALTGPSLIYVGRSATFATAATDSTGRSLTGRTLTWTSSDSSVIGISAAGIATAISVGEATIKAAVEGVEASARIKATLVPVATVEAKNGSVTPWLGDTLTLAVTARDSAGSLLTDRTVNWSSTNSAVATISKTGLLSAVSIGTTSIEAEVEGKRTTISVSVSLVPIAIVRASASASSIYVGDTVVAGAVATDTRGATVTGRPVTWATTQGSSIIELVGTSRFVARGIGSAYAIARIDGVSDSVLITVSAVPAASVTVTAVKTTLEVGDTTSAVATVRDAKGNLLTGRTVFWTTTTSTLLSINASGKITALAPGSGTVRAAVEGLTGEATILVVNVPVQSVTLTSSSLVLYTGLTSDVTASAFGSRGEILTGRSVTWATENAAVASVSATGRVGATGPGTTRVSATVEGKSAFAVVTVRRDPLVLIHGFGSSGTVWSSSVTKLVADGWLASEIVSWTYTSTQSNATTAAQLKTLVDSIRQASGALRIDIVTHSMGALPARYYLKNLGGQPYVDAMVSLAGPNHGTETALFCPALSCVEMRPNSVFLTELNSVDETPGAVRYATWWSPCDATIAPVSSTPLNGATNTQTACIGHSQFASDDAVYAGVRDFIKP